MTRIALFLGLLVGVVALQSGAVLGLSPTVRPADTADALVTGINDIRAGHGLSPLSWDAVLGDGGEAWADHLVAAGAWEHRSDLALMAAGHGDWRQVGENLARRALTGDAERDAAAVVGAFMDSPTHRANVLGPYDRVHVAVSRDQSGIAYFVVTFLG